MIIARYLTREVILSLTTVTFVLLLALLSQQVVRYLNYVAVGKVPTNVLFILIGFEIPYLLALLLPLGLYLGIILAFGRLYADQEMSILQMCGIGNRQLMRIIMMLALGVGSLILILMLWINPMLSAKRQKIMTSDETTLHLIQTLMPGRFQVSPDGHQVMYVEKLSRDKTRAENVFLAQEKKTDTPINEANKNNWMLVFAKEGYQKKDEGSQDNFFVTADGFRYEGIPGQNDYKIIQYKTYHVRIPQSDVRITHLENETLSTQHLWADYDNPKRAAELQWRFSIALSALLLAILAVPLSALRPRQGRFLIFIPAILLYVIYINLLFIARHWLEQGTIHVSLGLWWVHGLFIVLTLFLFLMHSRYWSLK